VPAQPLRTPPTRDFPTIRRSLVFYKTFAYATGTFLLLVCLEVIVRYVFGVEVLVGGPLGAVAFVNPALVAAAGGFNLSLALLIAHGYLYLAYLVSDFVLITVMRYPITRFIVIAAGGVIPFLSFFTERRVHHEVADYLAKREAAEQRKAAAAATA
jgi:integral membrane protein